MRNQTYLMLILLSYAVFMWASNELGKIEVGEQPVEVADTYTVIATVSMSGFSFSMLRLYQRTMGIEVKGDSFVSKILRRFTRTSNKARMNGGERETLFDKLKRSIKAGVSPSTILGMVVAFFILAYITPIGLNYLAVAVNASVNSTVKTVLTVVVPIIFALAMVLYFMPGSGTGGKKK